MEISELRNLTVDELAARVSQLESEYFTAKEEVRLGTEANTSKLKELRRDVARVKTIAREKQSLDLLK